MKKGFTLIELLIVIILILIAISLPNFLEAQVRAKVVNARAEMRGIAPAIQSYLTDWKRYPADGFELIGYSGYPEENPQIWVQLTTPVPYLSSMPVDEFHVALEDTQGNQRSEKNQTYRYYADIWRCLASGNNHVRIPGAPDECTLNAGAKGRAWPAPFDPDTAFLGAWVLYSPGPDRKHNFGEWYMHRLWNSIPALQANAPYSPTNGTMSIGDLIYWGN